MELLLCFPARKLQAAWSRPAPLFARRGLRLAAVNDAWSEIPVPEADAAPARKNQQVHEPRDPARPRTGDEIELVCSSLAFGGQGVCKRPTGPSDYVMLIDRALPGERLMARITASSRTHSEGRKIAVLVPHANAVEPPCPHYSAGCGGCTFQNLAYTQQAEAKRSQVSELLKRIGGFSADLVRPIVPAPLTLRYRNKCEFSFSPHVWTSTPPPPRPKMTKGGRLPPESPDVATRPVPGTFEYGYGLGFHAPGFFDKVMPVSRCLLQHDIANDILELVRAKCAEFRLEAYDPRSHKGYLRHLMLRKGTDVDSGAPQFLVNLITSQDTPNRLVPVVAALAASPMASSIRGIVNNVASGSGPASSSAAGDLRVERVLLGDRVLYERLRGLKFQITANSFFQVNTSQAENLYAEVERAADLRPGDILLDLFCGAGTIGLSLAATCRQLWGYELAPEAVENARINADLNGITNAQFVCGDLSLAKMRPEESGMPRPDVVITDPNRPGMTPKLLGWLQDCGARRIVYVSCNPSTMARDMAVLCGAGKYRLLSVTPVDMFPQTGHVEAVGVLELAS